MEGKGAKTVMMMISWEKLADESIRRLTEKRRPTENGRGLKAMNVQTHHGFAICFSLGILTRWSYCSIIEGLSTCWNCVSTIVLSKSNWTRVMFAMTVKTWWARYVFASHFWKLTSCHFLNVCFGTAQGWIDFSFNFLNFGFMFESWGTPTAGTPRNGGMTPKNGTPRNTTPRNGTPRKGATPRNEAGQFHHRKPHLCGIAEVCFRNRVAVPKLVAYHIYHQKPGNDLIQVVGRCFATATVIVSDMGLESEMSSADLMLHVMLTCDSGHLFSSQTSSPAALQMEWSHAPLG